MELISFDNTLATLIKTKNDLGKLLTIIVILTQIIFLGFYTYELIFHIKELFYVILYSSFIFVSILYLILYIFNRFKNKNKSVKFKTLNRIFRYLKYLLKLFALVYGVIQILNKETNTVMILLVALSGFMFILNIVSELVITYMENTINRFILAFYMDREENTLNKLITNDLNRENFFIPNEWDVRESIRRDRENYMVKNKPKKKEPWAIRKIKDQLEKHINKK